MSVSNIVRIGAEDIDITKPCDVALALKKMQLRLGVGDVRETVRIDGEEVTFQRANDARLSKLIAQYEAACDKASGKRRRFAKRVRWSS